MHEFKLVIIQNLSLIIHKEAQKNPYLQDYKQIIIIDDLSTKNPWISSYPHQAIELSG